MGKSKTLKECLLDGCILGKTFFTRGSDLKYEVLDLGVGKADDNLEVPYLAILWVDGSPISEVAYAPLTRCLYDAEVDSSSG